MGLRNPSIIAMDDFDASARIKAPLAVVIVLQETGTMVNNDKTKEIKLAFQRQKKVQLLNVDQSIANKLTPPKKRLLECSKEKGASSWLSVLRTTNHGFTHKGVFGDAIALRYGWRLVKLQSTCICVAAFDVGHVMSCYKGGYPTIRHNELRDMTAAILNEVSMNVATE